MNSNLNDVSLVNSTAKGVNDISNTIKEVDKQNSTLAGTFAGAFIAFLGVSVGAYIVKKF